VRQSDQDSRNKAAAIQSEWLTAHSSLGMSLEAHCTPLAARVLDTWLVSCVGAEFDSCVVLQPFCGPFNMLLIGLELAVGSRAAFKPNVID